ncbi:hypothetical protein B5V02_18195 [Mesorhizobium kowhaii]|uniref:Uncharacterized protein n=1 Tax=Mesorhizobium kowhaii TaxID=1300272 RepID=A0A2W7C2M9_9HYPH|nr:hypothetical protein B5V02_18195 [Mesorhizobium kowhaii]
MLFMTPPSGRQRKRYIPAVILPAAAPNVLALNQTDSGKDHALRYFLQIRKSRTCSLSGLTGSGETDSALRCSLGAHTQQPAATPKQVPAAGWFPTANKELRPILVSEELRLGQLSCLLEFASTAKSADELLERANITKPPLPNAPS